MLNRAAILVRYREPAVRWINEADPDPDGMTFTLEDVNRERTVYLVSDAHVQTDVDIRRWVQDNFGTLWESELEQWYTDEALWPSKRTLKRFDEWFEVECHTMVFDTSDEPLIDDEL